MTTTSPFVALPVALLLVGSLHSTRVRGVLKDQVHSDRIQHLRGQAAQRLQSCL
ncbi:hypothetical protein SAMN04487857_11134 [Pseudomonas sp. ok272]|nr:hypothetical protein SAMN04487857_11134 [Pseudomonas sp. ok272]SFN09260.1 hypothetical protein SAMN04487858_11234 [Pseudomonas sp. ok602]